MYRRPHRLLVRRGTAGRHAPPRESDYGYPGSPDDGQNADPVPAHQRTGFIEFDLGEVDVARQPGAEDAYDEVIQDGIVLLRLPLDRLAAGTTDVAGVNLSGGDEEFAWGLRVGLTRTPEAGTPSPLPTNTAASAVAFALVKAVAPPPHRAPAPRHRA